MIKPDQKVGLGARGLHVEGLKLPLLPGYQRLEPQSLGFYF
jgi:hypothetical protein